MTQRKHPDIGYLGGLITEAGTIAIIAGSAQLEEEDVDHTYIAIWKDRKWAVFQEEFSITAQACGRGAQARTVASLGMYGEAVINEPGGVHHERLGKGKDAPNELRTMHAVRCVGTHFYAVGMRRQVFRRAVVRGPWNKIDAGVFVPDSSKEIAGFLSVDGFDDREVYAVGYSGEIWLFDGKSWSQQSSPTNARLESVRCQADDTVMICGEAGLVLRGRRDAWVELGQDLTDESLMSQATLGSKTYFATESGLLIEYDGKKFGKTKLPGKNPPTTGFLDSNAEQLLSVGEEDILLYNGRSWTNMTDPPIDPT